MLLFLYFRLTMKYIKYIFFLFSILVFSQENIKTKLLLKTKIQADSIIGIDNFNTSIYTKNNTLIKNKEGEILKYSNLQLGEITSANSFNPLKINVFYKSFNTVIILDNRLAEIFKIDFNLTKPYKNVSHIATGSDNTIWIFNQDLMQLELYDYKTNTVRAKTLPITSNVLDLASNYNSCWLLTKNHIYKYNYFGSLVSKLPNNGYTQIKETNENIILKKENTLYFLDKNTNTIQTIDIQNLLISQFLVTNQIIYIYTGGFLHQYQLKIK